MPEALFRTAERLGMMVDLDLVCAETALDNFAARHANPLTGLPGHVPIQRHIERLLAAGAPFVAVYADPNAFKPYNAVYGFRRGDDMIALLGGILVEVAQAEREFHPRVSLALGAVAIEQCAIIATTRWPMPPPRPSAWPSAARRAPCSSIAGGVRTPSPPDPPRSGSSGSRSLISTTAAMHPRHHGRLQPVIS